MGDVRNALALVITFALSYALFGMAAAASPVGGCGEHGVWAGPERGCLCKPGWTGLHCEDSQNMCAGLRSKCEPHGFCEVSAEGVPSCVCADGWMGEHCKYRTCGFRGLYDPELDECECWPYAGHSCDECPKKEGRTLVCLWSHAIDEALPIELADQDVETALRGRYFANHPASDVFLPRSEYNGVQYDCGCEPYIVEEDGTLVSGARTDSLARFDIETSEDALNILLSTKVDRFQTTNQELIDAAEKERDSQRAELFWIGFFLFFILFCLAGAVLAAMVTFAFTRRVWLPFI